VEKAPGAGERDLWSAGQQNLKSARAACQRWRSRHPEFFLLQNIAAMRRKSGPDWRCTRGRVRSPRKKAKGRAHFTHAAFGNYAFALS